MIRVRSRLSLLVDGERNDILPWDLDAAVCGREYEGVAREADRLARETVAVGEAQLVGGSG
jgi:hypothetical protein